MVCQVGKSKIDLWERRSHSYFGDHVGWNLPLLNGGCADLENYWLHRAYPQRDREKLEPRCCVTEDIEDRTYYGVSVGPKSARASVFFEPGLRLDPFKADFWSIGKHCDEAWRHALTDLRRAPTKSKVAALTVISEQCEYKIKRSPYDPDALQQRSDSPNRFSLLQEICDDLPYVYSWLPAWEKQERNARATDLTRLGQWLNPSQKATKRQIVKAIGRHCRRRCYKLTESERNFFGLFAGAAALAKMLTQTTHATIKNKN